MQPAFLLYLIKASWPLRSGNGYPVTVYLTSLAVQQPCPAGWAEGGRSPPARPISCQHLHFVEAAFPPQRLAGPTHH